MAGVPGRVAMRTRQAAELSFALSRAMRAKTAVSSRQLLQVRRRLDACDLGRRFAGIRTRLVTADAHLARGISRRRDRARSQLRDNAGRLDTLSPLAVLGRGYAVCWNADRTVVLRDAAAATPGDRVRVTLHKGELDCEVKTLKSEI